MEYRRDMEPPQPDADGVDRREFIRKACAAGPVLLVMAKEAAAQPDQDGGYDPTEHYYGMAVDVEKCIGCGSCVDACRVENDVPQEHFRTWVERYIIQEDGEAVVESPNGGASGFSDIAAEGNLRAFFVPKLCNHCANPPCVQVCPVGATFTSPDGVVLVDAEYCIGCRYCIQACPYGARFLHPETHVAEKCTFCYHRVGRGLAPACVEVCPTGARVFGELRQRNSPLARFMRFSHVQVLKSHLNTEPKVYYASLDREVT
jgi:Fe-S-cluster-containing dehydrogenase component